ncbi:hypothetical protein BaRGS_00024121, partial [Batillaria attramentaria]
DEMLESQLSPTFPEGVTVHNVIIPLDTEHCETSPSTAQASPENQTAQDIVATQPRRKKAKGPTPTQRQTSTLATQVT